MKLIKVKVYPLFGEDAEDLKAEKLDDGVWAVKGKIKVLGEDEKEEEKERIIWLLFSARKFQTPGEVAKWILDNKPEDEEFWHISLDRIEKAFVESELEKLTKELEDKEI